jgi:hypothetical protein
MRSFVLFWAGFVTLILITPAKAAKPLPPPAALPPATPGQTTYQELTDFGHAVQSVGEYRDNRYRYDARVAELFQHSQQLENSKIQFTVTVERVTLEEVHVRVDDAGYTRVLLQHKEPPAFGNLRTVYYYGPASTIYYNHFAKPVGLRIGSEIPLEMAAHLRKRDVLQIEGKVGCMRTIIGPTFDPEAIATMTDWHVVKVVAADSSDIARK